MNKILENNFRHNHREEYLCVQMINIHLLSKFSSETISYCMNQSPIHYFSLTKSEAQLFNYINKFHSNGYLAKNKQLDYSRLDLAYITPLIPFMHFYQFISSNSQFIQNNGFWMSSKYNKSTIDKEKQQINNKCSSTKMISSSSNVCKSNNSYCRPILFHEKEIMSYSTISLTNPNETILCLSIKNIVLTYFPWSTPEKFLQLCRLKHIIRYKPDKSTNSDLSLRLISIHQLNQYWNFFIQQLLPNSKATSSHQSEINQQTNEKSAIETSPSLIINTNDFSALISSSNAVEQSFEDTSKNVSSLSEDTSKNVSSPEDTSKNISSLSEDTSKNVSSPSEEHSTSSTEHENPSCQMDSIQSIDNELIQRETNYLLNQLTEIIEKQQENSVENNNIDKEQNELIRNSLENKEEETILSTIENKTLKRKRRRSHKSFFTLKRRKHKKSNDQSQWWINKYSIEPISILLQRVNLPTD